MTLLMQKKPVPQESVTANIQTQITKLLTSLSLGLLWCLAQLPLPWLIQLGRFLGAGMYILLKRRTAITRRNIQASFPELTKDQQEAITKECILENICGVLESAKAWWGNVQPIIDEAQVVGIDIIQDALNSKEGCLLIGAHFSTLDMGGRVLSEVCALNILYRPFNNATYDAAVLKARKNFYSQVIEKNRMRDLVRSIQKGGILWYPADQDYGAKDSVFAPFFGVQAATLKTTAGLAKMCKGHVVALYHHRLPDNRYSIEFRSMPDFPINDPTAAAVRANEFIEAGIRINPAQYMWVHRRFKTRPEGEPNFYSTH